MKMFSAQRRQTLYRSLLCGIFLCLFLPLAPSASELRPSLHISLQEGEVVLEVALPPGTYTYLASPHALPLLLEADGPESGLFGEAIFPDGEWKGDERILRGNFVVRIPHLPGVEPARLEQGVFILRMQLCDEERNECLRPERHVLSLSGAHGGMDAPGTKAYSAPAANLSASEGLAQWLKDYSRSVLFALFLAFLGGILASITPCVYPVIPIILAFFAKEGNGQSARESEQGESEQRWRRFSGAFACVLGMALVYTALGLIAGLIGGAFASFISTPPVFIAVSLIFFFLALSLLDVVEFKLPFQMSFNRGALPPSNMQRRRVVRAFVMGVVAGFVASPCVGPVVFFILTEILQKGEALYGALLMFAFSLGFGVLFFVLALFGKRFSRLLSAGAWMVYVKIVLALCVFFASLYFLRQGLAAFFPAEGVVMYAAQALLILATILLSWRHFARQFGRRNPYAFVTAGLLILFFMFSLMRPHTALDWGDNLDLALEESRVSGQKIFIDVTADWCTACRELEKEFMAHGELRRFIEENAIPLRLNYDKNERRLTEEYDVRSLPCLLVLDANGRLIWKKSGFTGIRGLATELSNVLLE
jgi:thiol:disulfide interchange protein DsbD